MRSKTIVIQGKPQGKDSLASHGVGMRIRQEQTIDYEAKIRAAWFQQADGWLVRDGGVGVIVTAYCPIPKSASKDRKSGMLSGRIAATVKPVADSVLKIVLDALTGHAWVDDKQVVAASVQKLYSEQPRVEVVLYDC